MADDRNKYKVPTGFRMLLECLSKEVLRNQPADIYAFSALFFEKLLEFRDGYPGQDVLNTKDTYTRLRECITDEAIRRGLLNPADASSMPTTGQTSNSGTPANTDREAQAATKIQAAYKSFQVREHPEKFGLPANTHLKRHRSSERLHTHTDRPPRPGSADPIEKAATKIQSEIRGYLQRKHYHEIQEDLRHAAIKIQAGYRGYATRKKMGISPKPSPHHSPPPGKVGTPSQDALDENKAATKIQATFKGHRARQEIHQQEKAATKIQAVYRGHNVRNSSQEPKPPKA